MKKAMHPMLKGLKSRALKEAKRELMRQWGFPVETPQAHFVNKGVQGEIENFLRKIQSTQHTYVITSLPVERAPEIHVPPFYEIFGEKGLVFERHPAGFERVGWDRLVQVISALPIESHVSLVDPIWSQPAIAGRIQPLSDKGVCFVELQEGVQPSLLGLCRDTHPYFAGEIDLKAPALDLSQTTGLYAAQIFTPSMCDAWRALARLSDPLLAPIGHGLKPIYEFCFHKNTQSLVFVDVDWVEQWSSTYERVGHE